MVRFIGLLAIIPTTILLTISFFVLFALRKTETQGLKAFGYVVIALLWCGALLVSSVGVYTIATGRCIMQEMTQCKIHGMMCTQTPKMMPAQK